MSLKENKETEKKIFSYVFWLLVISAVRKKHKHSWFARFVSRRVSVLEPFFELAVFGSHKVIEKKYDAVLLHDPISFGLGDMLNENDIDIIVDVIEVIPFRSRFGASFHTLNSSFHEWVSNIAFTAVKKAHFRLFAMQSYAESIKEAVGEGVTIHNSHPVPCSLKLTRPASGKLRIIAANSQSPETLVLELIQAADSYENEIELYIGSNISPKSYRLQVEALVESRPWVKLIPVMPHLDLISFIKSCDVGLNIFSGVTGNGVFATPNRLFDYITSGIPIVTTNSGDSARIVHDLGNGCIVGANAAEALQAAIDTARDYDEFKLKCRAAVNVVNWDVERGKLLSLFSGRYSNVLFVAPKDIKANQRLKKYKLVFSELGVEVDTLESFRPAGKDLEVGRIEGGLRLYRGTPSMSFFGGLPVFRKFWLLSLLCDCLYLKVSPNRFVNSLVRKVPNIDALEDSYLQKLYKFKLFSDKKRFFNE